MPPRYTRSNVRSNGIGAGSVSAGPAHPKTCSARPKRPGCPLYLGRVASGTPVACAVIRARSSSHGRASAGVGVPPCSISGGNTSMRNSAGSCVSARTYVGWPRDAELVSLCQCPPQRGRQLEQEGVGPVGLELVVGHARLDIVVVRVQCNPCARRLGRDREAPWGSRWVHRGPA